MKNEKEEIKEEIIIEDDTEFKVGIYLRLSSKDLDDAVSDSIENQKAVVPDYISEHPEFDTILASLTLCADT